MSSYGSFKYVGGWFAVVKNDAGVLVRLGPFDTEEQAEKQREAYNTKQKGQ